MSYRLHIPQFFAKSVNAEVKELFASSAIANAALAIVTIFEPIFLYAVLGFTVVQVLLFMALVYALYVVLIPFGGYIASRLGYKHAIFFSIPFQILFWLSLFAAQSEPYFALAAPFLFAIQKTLFWPAYHADMTTAADKKQVGREFSVIYAVIQIAFVAGPFIGGWLSERFGVGSAFIVASALYACSFVPLMVTKEQSTGKPYKFRQTLDLMKLHPKQFIGYLGFGEELIALAVWPIFIFVTVKDFQSTGALVTVATLVSTILALYIGRASDRFNKTVLIKVGSFFSSLTFLATRVASSAMSVFFLDAFFRTSKEVNFIPLSTVTYERAKDEGPLPYVIFFEQTLAIGKLFAAVLAAAIFAMTGSFFAVFVLAAIFGLLYMFL